MNQKIFFKCVRNNYGSFHDESFKWPARGIVEVKDAYKNGPCGKGLHLAVTLQAAISYGAFPFRILKVKPLSPILGQDDTKIRVAKAKVMREILSPDWTRKIERNIKKIKLDVEVIPWFKGADGEKAKRLIRSHLKLLIPFGFKTDWEIKILTTWASAFAACPASVSAWAAACDSAVAAARDSARDSAVARDSAWDTASAWDAVWDSAKDSVEDSAVWARARDSVAGALAKDFALVAAWNLALAAAWDSALAAAWDSATWDLLEEKNPFKPLWECWKIGAWPIGFVGKKFLIYTASQRGR